MNILGLVAGLDIVKSDCDVVEDFTTETWMFINENVTIGAATATEKNPLIMDMDMPLLVPKGTTGAGLGYGWQVMLQYLTDFDTVEYGELWSKVSNSTTGNYFFVDFFLNGTLRYGHSKGSIMGAWEDIVMYFKNLTIINGVQKFTLDIDGAIGYEVNVSLGVTSTNRKWKGPDKNVG